MRKGAPYAADRSRYSKQTNNAFEEAYKTKYGEHWLEDCGPTSLVNAAMSLLDEVPVVKLGDFELQLEDVCTCFFHDYRNFADFKSTRDFTAPELIRVPKNEIPQYYPLAAKKLFGLKGELLFGLCFDAMKDRIVAGNCAVQICLKTPSHFVTVVQYDTDADALVYNDPYPERFSNGDGFNVLMSRVEFLSNVNNYFIIYTR